MKNILYQLSEVHIKNNIVISKKHWPLFWEKIIGRDQ